MYNALFSILLFQESAGWEDSSLESRLWSCRNSYSGTSPKKHWGGNWDKCSKPVSFQGVCCGGSDHGNSKFLHQQTLQYCNTQQCSLLLLWGLDIKRHINLILLSVWVCILMFWKLVYYINFGVLCTLQFRTEYRNYEIQNDFGALFFCSSWGSQPHGWIYYERGQFSNVWLLFTSSRLWWRRN